MMKPLYRRKDMWILGICTVCNRANYVEQHGTTAPCKCSPDWTEHISIPYAARGGMMGEYVITSALPKPRKLPLGRE